MREKTFTQVDGNLPKSLAVFDFLTRLLRRERIKFQFCPFCPAWKQTKHFSILFFLVYIPVEMAAHLLEKTNKMTWMKTCTFLFLFLFLLAKYHRGGCCGFLLFQTDERKLVIMWVSGAHRFQQRFFFYFYCKRLNFLLCFSPSVRAGRRNNRIRYDHLFHFHFRPVFSCWQLTLENWAILTLMTSFFTFLYNATWIELSQSARISKHKNKTTIPFSSFQWPSLWKKTNKMLMKRREEEPSFQMLTACSVGRDGNWLQTTFPYKIWFNCAGKDFDYKKNNGN